MSMLFLLCSGLKAFLHMNSQFGKCKARSLEWIAIFRQLYAYSLWKFDIFSAVVDFMKVDAEELVDGET